MTFRCRRMPLLFSMAAFILSAGPALAGPPLVCFPFEIGTATSLPWVSDGQTYKGMRPGYDLSHLKRDTIALLTPSTPVVVRMETLRRATLYASLDDTIAKGLLDALRSRAEREGADAALSHFDAGYLIETYRQAAPIAPALGRMVEGIDGYRLVLDSLEARHGEPAIAFAAALITSRDTGVHAEHVRAARAGATADLLLARNIGHVSP